MDPVRAKPHIGLGSGSSNFNNARPPTALEEFRRLPWLVPANQPLELTFFHNLYVSLLTESSGRRHPMNHGRQTPDKMSTFSKAMDDRDTLAVPLMLLQRAMARLFRVFNEDRIFDARRYDMSGDGHVGWWEFCIFWNTEKPTIRLTTMERICLTFEDSSSSRLAKLVSVFVLSAIFVSAGSFVISTMPSMQDPPACPRCEPKPFKVFAIIDTVCVILFTLEYLVRLVASAFMRPQLVNKDNLISCMCSDEVLPTPSRIRRALAFGLGWANLIDLAAIVPSYIAWALEAFAEEGSRPAWQASVVKLTRLMRVVRAFRMGRRFEAVVIVVRSMKKSMRALWVLALNVTMGMLIFGSMMFFLEQGEYQPSTRSYERIPNGAFEDEWGKTPFQSIPHAFWWALVTSATVGYGDVYPITEAGKMVASITMVWSLCVIALPIGVIGLNFEVVWREYDMEKLHDILTKAKDAEMSKDTVLSLEPLNYSRMARFEVFHDSCLAGEENDVFLGQAEAELELCRYETDRVEKTCVLPLQGNWMKSARQATGELKIEYVWTPDDKWTDPNSRPEPGTLLLGTLTVTVVSAHGLQAVDWKRSGIPDPYVRVALYPESPGRDGLVVEKVVRTGTSFDKLTPQWQQTLSFKYAWHQDGVVAKQEMERRRCLEKTAEDSMTLLSSLQGSTEPTPNTEVRRKNIVGNEQVEEVQLIATLAALRGEVAALRAALPQLRNEVTQLQLGAMQILARLKEARQLVFAGVVPQLNLPGTPAQGPS